MITPGTRATTLRLLFWAGIIALAVVSVIPREYLMPPGFNTWDKLQHVLAYSILSVLGGLAYPGKKYLAAIFFGLVILGSGLELIQSIVPNREASFWDGVANTIGAGTGIFIALFFFRVKNKSPKCM
jgi:VanZ family protein